jgi:hypothetical protein
LGPIDRATKNLNLALADDVCCVWFIHPILEVTQVSEDRD